MYQLPDTIEQQIQTAVEFFWQTRKRQGNTQADRHVTDQGNRSQVTGGKQLDGFVDLMQEMLLLSGVRKEQIFVSSDLELPGFFRPNKKWDLLVMEDKRLLAAVELKSQVGPSFSNNFNNRTEEAMGSAVDIWTAYRQGAFGAQAAPFLGYFMVLEDCPKSAAPVKNRTPHFPVFPEFQDASYQKRYEIFCTKLMLERYYSQTCFLTTKWEQGKVTYQCPKEALSVQQFLHALLAAVHISG